MQRQSLRIFDIVSLLLNPSVLMGVFFCLLAVTFELLGSSRIISALIAVFFTTIGIWFLRLLCFTLIFVQFPPSDLPYNLYHRETLWSYRQPIRGRLYSLLDMQISQVV